MVSNSKPGVFGVGICGVSDGVGVGPWTCLRWWLCLCVCFSCISLHGSQVSIHAQLITGGSGYALQFNGVSFVSVSRPCGSENPFAVSSVTLESWFRLAGDKHDLAPNPRTSVSQDSLNQASIMGLGWEAGYEVQYDYLQNHLRFQTQGPGFFDGPGNPPSPNCWSSETATKYPVKHMQGVWHHIATVWDASTFEKSIYLDGQLVFNVTCPGASLTVSGRVFFVGGTYTTKGLSPNSIAPFYGQIDETRLWSVARTQQQIQDYMHRPIPPSLFSQMITYLRFDEGVGTFSLDMAHADNEFLALDASLGTGVLGWAPKFVPSTAPIVVPGAPQVQVIRTAHITQPPTLLPIGYIDPQTQQYATTGGSNSSSASTVTVRDISDPRYLPYLQCVSSTGTSTPASLNQTCTQLAISSIPVILPNTTTNETGTDPATTATVWLDYVVSVGSTVSPNPPNRMIISLIPNMAPAVGSSGYALYCDGVNDYALSDDFRWDTGLPVTVEVWALTYAEMVQQAVVFSVGNSEVVGQWCTDNPTGEPTRCRGRFMAHIPWNDKKLGWHYGWAPGLRGPVQIDITPRLGEWSHYAMVSDGRNSIPDNGTMRLYANGELIGEFPADGPVGDDPFKGLLICDWRYWGPLAHHGYIDDFRIWNRTLSVDEIKSRMYGYDDIGRGKRPPEGLVVAYDFDEDPVTAVGYAEDISGNGHTLYFGACQTSENITEPHTHAGVPHCHPNMPFQNPDSFPARVMDSALTRYSDDNFQWDQTIPLGSQGIMITLNGSDANGDRMAARITQLPSRGTLTQLNGQAVTTSDWIWQDLSSQMINIYMNVSAGQGGYPYAIFTYQLTDGLLLSPSATVRVDVPCDVGTYLDNTAKVCRPCPAGSYQSAVSFLESCLAVPINSYQPVAGQSSYLNCSNQTFSDSLGATTCKICSDYDYPSAYCLLSSNVQPKAHLAITVICAICLALVAIITLIILWHRHSRVIFSSSTLMTALCLMGCLGLLTSVMVLIAPQTQQLCTAKHWIFQLSLGLTLLSLLAKTYRLNSIFNSSVLDSNRQALSNQRLGRYIAMAMLYDVVILAVWNGLNPMSINNVNQRTCISSHELTYQLFLFIPKVLFLICILVLAYRTRSIPVMWNETRGLYISMVNLVLISFIVLLMALSSNMSYRSEKILISGAIIFVVMLIISALMGPKLLQLKQETIDGSGLLLSQSNASHMPEQKHSNDKPTPAPTPAPASPLGHAVPTKKGSVSGGSGSRSSLGGVGAVGTAVGAVLPLGSFGGVTGSGSLDSTVMFQHASALDLWATRKERKRKYRQLDVAIGHAKDKLAALQNQAKQVAAHIHMLDMETNYRQAMNKEAGAPTNEYVTATTATPHAAADGPSPSNPSPDVASVGVGSPAVFGFGCGSGAFALLPGLAAAPPPHQRTAASDGTGAASATCVMTKASTHDDVSVVDPDVDPKFHLEVDVSQTRDQTPQQPWRAHEAGSGANPHERHISLDAAAEPDHASGYHHHLLGHGQRSSIGGATALIVSASESATATTTATTTTTSPQLHAHGHASNYI